jgi:polysaccharide export outer membrane protein
MRWAYRIAFVALAALVAAAPARADGQPKYATMQKSWSPQPQQAPVHLAAVQQPQDVTSNNTDDYKLGTGDKVRITVFGEDDLSGEFQVDSTGYLRLPMIGQVRAAGDTAHALEDQLTATYSQGYLLEPRVNVEVTTYRPFYIIGEVNKPGEYAYVNGMNVLNAVALAGGFTQKATEGHVYLRKANTNQEIRVAADQTITVMPGDIVRVSSSPVWDVLSIVAPLAPFAHY